MWWGAGSRDTAEWAGEQGVNLMSSTLLTEATGDSFASLQAEQIAELESKNSRLETDKNTLRGYVTNVELILDKSKKGLEAMDWFWQIDEAYAKGRYSLCRSLITSLDEAGLTEYLPKESITDNDRFSPYDRLAEIREIVY